MKKLIEIYDKFANYVCKFSGDKYVHLIVGLLVSFAVAWVFALTTAGGTKLNCAFCGMATAVVVGIVKEVLDLFRGGKVDPFDILFTFIGGTLGFLFYLM